MEYRYSCPACRKVYRITESHFEKNVKCRECNLVFQIPNAEHFIKNGTQENLDGDPVRGSDGTATNTKIIFFCYKCGRKYTVDPSNAGKSAPCHSCKTMLKVPEMTTESPSNLMSDSNQATMDSQTDSAVHQHKSARKRGFKLGYKMALAIAAVVVILSALYIGWDYHSKRYLRAALAKEKVADLDGAIQQMKNHIMKFPNDRANRLNLAKYYAYKGAFRSARNVLVQVAHETKITNYEFGREIIQTAGIIFDSENRVISRASDKAKETKSYQSLYDSIAVLIPRIKDLQSVVFYFESSITDSIAQLAYYKDTIYLPPMIAYWENKLVEIKGEILSSKASQEFQNERWDAAADAYREFAAHLLQHNGNKSVIAEAYFNVAAAQFNGRRLDDASGTLRWVKSQFSEYYSEERRNIDRLVVKIQKLRDYGGY